MSGLALAGALSGMGQGLQQGLVNMQQGFIQSGLLKERDEMENKRLRLTFEHQEKLQTEKIASDRAIHEETLQNAKDINQTNVGMHIATTGMTNEANKEIHAETNATNKDIHKATNDLSRDIAKMQDLRKEMEINASLDISKNSSYVSIVKSSENDIGRLRVHQLGLEKVAQTALPGDPVFDEIKNTSRQIEEAAKELHLYQSALAKRIGAPELPAVPKFKLAPELMRPGSAAAESNAAASANGAGQSSLDAMPPYRRTLVVPPTLVDPRAPGVPPPTSFGQRLTESLVNSFGGDYRPPDVQITPRR